MNAPSCRCPRTTAVIADPFGPGSLYGQIDPAILLVVGVEGDVEQACLPFAVNGRRAANGLRHDTALDDAEPPFLFGHHDAAVRQEREAPRLVDPLVTVSRRKACSSLATEMLPAGFAKVV